jgi:hypothetical protein
MVRTALLGLVVLTGCAGVRASSTTTRAAPIELTEKGRGLFVGHTDNGDVVIAATHYNAMNGLAVLDTDLGVEAKDSQGLMLCSREVVTGTHLPRWLCRYQRDLDRNRLETELAMGMPYGAPHVQSGVGGAAVQGPGSGSRGGKTLAQ